MRGLYILTAEISSIESPSPAPKTLMLFKADDKAAFKLVSAKFTNASNNVNEQLECAIYRVTTLGSPAGSAVQVGKSEKGDPDLPASGLLAANCLRLANLTTEPTTYDTAAPIDLDGFPSLAGYRFRPIPEEFTTIAPNEAIGLYLRFAPGSSFKGLLQMNVLRIGN